MKLDPECPPAPHNVYSRMHTCNGRFRTASKIEVGVESYSEATVSKYIRRSGTTLRAVVRGGVEWGVNYGYPMVDALSINTVAGIMKVLRADQSISDELIHNGKGQGRSRAH